MFKKVYGIRVVSTLSEQRLSMDINTSTFPVHMQIHVDLKKFKIFHFSPFINLAIYVYKEGGLSNSEPPFFSETYILEY